MAITSRQIIDFLLANPSMSDAEWADCLKRNKDHLDIMIAKDYWTTEDLAPLQAAAA